MRNHFFSGLLFPSMCKIHRKEQQKCLNTFRSNAFSENCIQLCIIYEAKSSVSHPN